MSVRFFRMFQAARNGIELDMVFKKYQYRIRIQSYSLRMLYAFSLELVSMELYHIGGIA